jgi:putative transposase
MQGGIRAKGKREFVVTTDSKHASRRWRRPVAVSSQPRGPQSALVWRHTYIANDEGWLYLAATIDLLSRQVLGWSLQQHRQVSLVRDALAMGQVAPPARAWADIPQR